MKRSSTRRNSIRSVFVAVVLAVSALLPTSSAAADPVSPIPTARDSVVVSADPGRFVARDGEVSINRYRANVLPRVLNPKYSEVAVQNIQLIVPTQDPVVKEPGTVQSVEPAATNV